MELVSTCVDGQAEDPVVQEAEHDRILSPLYEADPENAEEAKCTTSLESTTIEVGFNPLKPRPPPRLNVSHDDVASHEEVQVA